MTMEKVKYSLFERQRELFESCIDSITELKAVRPAGYKWEVFREEYFDFVDPEDEEAMFVSEKSAYNEWQKLNKSEEQ